MSKLDNLLVNIRKLEAYVFFSFIKESFLCVIRYVIECPNCGVIYRSRQYWYGNQDPVDTVVRTEIHHIWPGVRKPYSLSPLKALYVYILIIVSFKLEL